MKRKDLNYKNAGFTMVELLVYIALIGTIATSFVSFSLYVGNVRNKTYSAQEVQANVRTALDIISQKIRSAEDVISPTEGNTATVLVLDMQGGEPNITFDVSAGILQMTEGAGSPIPLTSTEVSVENIDFTNLAPVGRRDNIKIESTFQFSNTEDPNFSFTRDYETSVSIRK